MFTGIVTDIGQILAAEARGDLRLRIGCGYDMAGVALGASISCSGVCLTVVDKGPDWFAVDVSAETRARTAPGQWEAGARLNLERALKVAPGKAELLDTMAAAMEKDKQVDKALEWQRKAVTAAPAVPVFRFRLAKLLIAAGERGQARAELEKLAALGGRYDEHAEVVALLKSL